LPIPPRVEAKLLPSGLVDEKGGLTIGSVLPPMYRVGRNLFPLAILLIPPRVLTVFCAVVDDTELGVEYVAFLAA